MSRIRFEDLPSTNTPINAENLNKLNNVVISPTEPTTGEEVWLKNTKNLLNEKQGFTNEYIGENGGIYHGDNNALFRDYIPVFANEQYTLSANTSMRNLAISFFAGNFTFISRNAQNNVQSITVTIPTNAKYIRISVNYNDVTTMTQAIINSLNLQLEKNSTATSYEPYVEKEIYSKNENGAYESFMNTNTIVVTQEGTNLNAYKKTGSYYFSSGSITPVNIPAGVAGWLQVFDAGHDNVKQVWHRAATINGSAEFETYVRLYNFNSNTWSNWERFATKTQVDTISNNVSNLTNNLGILSVTSEVVSGGTAWSKTLDNATYLIIVARSNGATTAGLYIANINTTSFLTEIKHYYSDGTLQLDNKTLSITPNASTAIVILRIAR